MTNLDIVLESAKKIDDDFYETLKEVVEECKYDNRWNEFEDKKNIMIVEAEVHCSKVRVMIFNPNDEDCSVTLFPTIKECQKYILSLIKGMNVGTVYIDISNFGVAVHDIIAATEIDDCAKIIPLRPHALQKTVREMMLRIKQDEQEN